MCEPAPAYSEVTVFPLKKVLLRLFCRSRTIPQCSDFKELGRSDPTERVHPMHYSMVDPTETQPATARGALQTGSEISITTVSTESGQVQCVLESPVAGSIQMTGGVRRKG